MVLIEVSPTVHFCIDSTEVSRGQYKTFLDTNPLPSSQPSFCSWNTDLSPNTAIAPLTLTTLPVTKLDWCDAYAFCAWAGKRLCGSLADGGPTRAPDGPLHALAEDASTSEWMTACSHNNASNFPYGPTLIPSNCNHDGGTDPAPVGSYPNCVGGYPGLFDMIGNVTEWENFCDDGVGKDAKCLDRGGSYAGGAENRCNYASLDNVQVQSSDWGVRCCATPSR
jgi:sulfatase modifying factor 1